jgi:hypothetical protein
LSSFYRSLRSLEEQKLTMLEERQELDSLRSDAKERVEECFLRVFDGGLRY